MYKLTYVNKFSNVVERIIEDEAILNELTQMLDSVGVHYTVENLEKGWMGIPA
jgi:hypothetical protein